MTKTLTEQWREGTLPRGGYYIKLLDGSIKQTNYDNISKVFDTELFQYSVSIKEVLAPVPSYDEWQAELASNYELLNVQKRLEKKLEIATKALKDILNDGDDYWDKDKAQEALTKMKGVK